MRDLPLTSPLLAVLVIAAIPSAAAAHSAGALDPHGCHTDRRSAIYHCHRGDYRGLKFSSKSDMLQKKAEGYTGADQHTVAAERRRRRHRRQPLALRTFR